MCGIESVKNISKNLVTLAFTFQNVACIRLCVSQ